MAAILETQSVARVYV